MKSLDILAIAEIVKADEEKIRADERNKMIEILKKFFPDEPCNYNGMDENADCEWCSEHCDSHTAKECWEHAIKEKWYER